MRFLSIAALSSLLAATAYAHAIESRDSHTSNLEERDNTCNAGTEPSKGKCQDCTAGYFVIPARMELRPALSALPTLSPLAAHLAALIVPVARPPPLALRNAPRPAALDSTGAVLSARLALLVTILRPVRCPAQPAHKIPTRPLVLVLVPRAQPDREVRLVRPVSASASTSVPMARSIPTVAARPVQPALTRATMYAIPVLLVLSQTLVPRPALLVLEVLSLLPTPRIARIAHATHSRTATTALRARQVPLPTLVRVLAVPSLPSVLSPSLELGHAPMASNLALFCPVEVVLSASTQ
ncbi:hypothetical protein FRC11_010529 [Ceratobasidium sp. 423]|nr:hypothetical protein FRC11_010529 [Ceratobasidium sp. 423]